MISILLLSCYAIHHVKAGCASTITERQIVSNRIYACSGTFSGGGTRGEEAAALCGTGYHVCESATEAEELGLTAELCATGVAQNEFEFFGTQESSSCCGQCASVYGADGENDIWGCAYDDATTFHAPCGVLNSQMANGDWNGWDIPTAVGSNVIEAVVYSLTDDTSGGVLCCTDSTSFTTTSAPTTSDTTSTSTTAIPMTTATDTAIPITTATDTTSTSTTILITTTDVPTTSSTASSTTSSTIPTSPTSPTAPTSPTSPTSPTLSTSTTSSTASSTNVPSMTGNINISPTGKTTKENKTTMWLVVLCVLIAVITCCTLLYWVSRRKYRGYQAKKGDDKNRSLSAMDQTKQYGNVNVSIGINVQPSAPPADNEIANNEVSDWMVNTVGFEQYAHHLVNNGYDTLQMVMDITKKEELEEVGIALKGHQTRIMKHIDTLRSNRANAVFQTAGNINVGAEGH